MAGVINGDKFSSNGNNHKRFSFYFFIEMICDLSVDQKWWNELLENYDVPFWENLEIR